jgi:hypothetical protein
VIACALIAVSLQLPLTCVWKKKEKLTEPVYDCNNLATVIATRSLCVLQKWKPDFVCLLLDCLNMIANLGSK